MDQRMIVEEELEKLDVLGRRVQESTAMARQDADKYFLHMATVHTTMKESARYSLHGFVEWVADTFRTKNVEGLRFLVRAYIARDLELPVEKFLEAAENVTIFSLARTKPVAPPPPEPEPAVPNPVTPQSSNDEPSPVVPIEIAPSPLPPTTLASLPTTPSTPPPPALQPAVVQVPPTSPPALHIQIEETTSLRQVDKVPPPSPHPDAELLPSRTKTKQHRRSEPPRTPRPAKKAKVTSRQSKRVTSAKRKQSAVVEVISIDDDDDDDGDEDGDEDYEEPPKRKSDKPALPASSPTTATATASAATTAEATVASPVADIDSNDRSDGKPSQPTSTTSDLPSKRSKKPRQNTSGATASSSVAGRLHLLTPRKHSNSAQRQQQHKTPATSEPSVASEQKTELTDTRVLPPATEPAKARPLLNQLLHDSMGVDDAKMDEASLASVDDLQELTSMVVASKPWTKWGQRLRSFLPNDTPERQAWNSSLADYFDNHAFTLWHRYFHMDVPNDLKAQQDDATSHAQAALYELAHRLHAMEGDDVFKFLKRAPHPAWPSWLPQPIQLRDLNDDDAVKYLKTQSGRRWPELPLKIALNGQPFKPLFDPLGILTTTPDVAFFKTHNISPTWAHDLLRRLEADSVYDVSKCAYVGVTMFGESPPQHLPNQVASAYVWDWKLETVVHRVHEL
ncbi:hypothetical protein H257_11503 [Aphanomyces astaci]|uniref:Uncharacterized protein n=1 Tax=Aphanomyces astaci TaxID=112090 RepID=W4G4E6_APHAT|nr:hypothetical protein H257_11503 [Aphanomyces astaci]ETV73833.1 hypothetical protein H257_11503 [Aphanomyces astaci]|eukprot:XP_009836769.1 hypothetical protein H257_11503 [Aphanomyces astaci]